MQQVLLFRLFIQLVGPFSYILETMVTRDNVIDINLTGVYHSLFGFMIFRCTIQIRLIILHKILI